MLAHLARAAVLVNLALWLAFATAGGVGATVTYDPATGVGHVDKGDVQQAFGWRDSTFQANARKLSFHAARYTAWTWDCLIDGALQTLTADVESSWAVASEAVTAASRRKAAPVIGFELTGRGASLSTSSDGGSPAGCDEGEPTNVSSSATDVLYVVFRSQTRPLWSN